MLHKEGQRDLNIYCVYQQDLPCEGKTTYLSNNCGVTGWQTNGRHMWENNIEFHGMIDSCYTTEINPNSITKQPTLRKKRKLNKRKRKKKQLSANIQNILSIWMIFNYESNMARANLS